MVVLDEVRVPDEVLVLIEDDLDLEDGTIERDFMLVLFLPVLIILFRTVGDLYVPERLNWLFLIVYL
jgi:hypothetical protein